MAETTPLSPTSLFARIESLKKWQMEQQQRLLQQQSQQTKFLSHEHKRMYDALGIKQMEESTIYKTDEHETPERNKHAFSNNHNESESEYSDEELDNFNLSQASRNPRDIDEIPIKSRMKDFTALLEEKLQNDTPVLNEYGKPKQKFLKKGAGLSRFRMTIQDLAHKKSKLPLNKNNRSLPQNKEKSKVEVPAPKTVEIPKQNKKSSKTCFPQKTQSNSSNVIRYSGSKSNTISKNEVKDASTSHDYKIESLVLNSENLAIRKKNSSINTDNFITLKSMSSNDEYPAPRATWTTTPEEEREKPTDYQTLLAELIEVRQRNPALFDTPLINQSTENEQQIFERDLLDELKLFEVLEQKASNSSFCSTSSLVTRLMDHPVKSTPKKQLNFMLLTNGIPEEDHVEDIKPFNSPPKRTVSFSDQAIQHEPSFQEDTEDEIIISNDESDSESSSDSNSSINSDDICDLKTIVPTVFKNHKPNTSDNKKSVKDVATNTDQSVVNSELLKTRLEQLENELDTFRFENARINKLKLQLETDSRNYEKRKRQLDREVEEQKKQMKAQLDEERMKLAKDRSVYDKYAREVKEGKSARQKEREEINALRSRLKAIEEEMKLKECKWGATQARIRSQLRHLEKDNATLRTENNELRNKNGKLEATNKQLLSRRPSETKVLHEINKNLTKLAQETKEKTETTEKRKSLNKDKTQNSRRPRSQCTSSNSSSPKIFPENNDDKENNRNSLNSTNDSKSSTDHSFESVEREYEKLFGKTFNEDNENTKLPAAEASTCSNMSGKREETVLEDGSMRITYSNGNVRTVSADGQMLVIQYHNGDVKETCKETGTIRYLHSDAKTWHTTFPDGMELLEFPNGQIEKRFSNGASEILFPNGCRRCTSPDGTEEVKFPDGTLLFTREGERILTLPNGQREIHTKDHKRREYPDGTIKLLYPDGVQETRYANGRIRLKDKQGNLIMDSATV